MKRKFIDGVGRSLGLVRFHGHGQFQHGGARSLHNAMPVRAGHVKLVCTIARGNLFHGFGGHGPIGH